jgi:cytochrome c biogenesis protein ResB
MSTPSHIIYTIFPSKSIRPSPLSSLTPCSALFGIFESAYYVIIKALIIAATMSSLDRLPSSPAAPKQSEPRQLAQNPKGRLSAATRQKECIEQCLQNKRGLTSSEKNCIIVCYQQSGMPRRKGLEI